jgi:hypothetical protein
LRFEVGAEETVGDFNHITGSSDIAVLDEHSLGLLRRALVRLDDEASATARARKRGGRRRGLSHEKQKYVSLAVQTTRVDPVIRLVVIAHPDDGPAFARLLADRKTLLIARTLRRVVDPRTVTATRPRPPERVDSRG